MTAREEADVIIRDGALRWGNCTDAIPSDVLLRVLIERGYLAVLEGMTYMDGDLTSSCYWVVES